MSVAGRMRGESLRERRGGAEVCGRQRLCCAKLASRIIKMGLAHQHTRNGPLPQELDGRGALGGLSGLTEDLGGEHRYD